MEDTIPMVSSWDRRLSTDETIKENPGYIRSLYDEFDIPSAGIATLGIGATTFIPHFVGKRYPMNWWQDLLLSTGVAIGGTIAIGQFMSKRYSTIFFWTSTGTVIVKGIRELLSNRGIYGISQEISSVDQWDTGFDKLYSDDLFTDNIFGMSEVPQMPTDTINPTYIGEVEFGI